MCDETEHKGPLQKVSKPVAGLAALGLAMGLGWTLSSGFSSPSATVDTSATEVVLNWPYRGICQGVTVEKDGQPLTGAVATASRGTAHIALPLSVGRHDLTLKFQTVVPGMEREYPVVVTVDQEAPHLQAGLEGQAPELRELATTESRFVLAGKTEPGSRLSLENQQLSVDSEGRFSEPLTLQPGWNHLLLSSSDAAGNKATEKFSLFFDTEEPEVVWQTTPDQMFPSKSARLELDLKDDGEIAGVSGVVDGDKPVAWHAKGDGRWVGITPDLHEGFHEVSIKAVDGSGQIVTSTRQVLIDSSEALGDAVLGLGARGQDVRLLNERLAESGYLLGSGTPSEVFDRATQAALKKLQEKEGFKVTGLAEGDTLIALGPRIFINLSQYSLVLDRPGKEQRRWMIASGSYDHPTPVGAFTIVEKVKDPTWLPPKSDWAKDAKPIPPGPDNPLGTRWLGFDWGGVGVHGTNAPWTVGSAASHGCMRMVSDQVEELFDLVEVGTPVVVLGGWENDPRLEKYWPTEKSDEPKDEPEELANR